MGIIEKWATRFVHETHDLRQRHKNILLILDGFDDHISFKALQLIRNNNICVYPLPANIIHLTQPLDLFVLFSFKTYFRNKLNGWIMALCKIQIN